MGRADDSTNSYPARFPAAQAEGFTSEDLRKLGLGAGRYTVGETVGQGSMGTVVRAYDSKLRRSVALKLVRADALDEAGQIRVDREAQAMARLSHPNVVAVYDVEIAPLGVMIVMELVPGCSLKAWLALERRPWREVFVRLVDAGRGLQAAHAAGLIHRDFKPANVLVGDDGRVRVSDFGLAKSVSAPPDAAPSRAGDAKDEPLRASLTASNAPVGTPRYMAPEQHDASASDARSDQYAFCVALWEGLNGRVAFQGEGLLAKKLAGPPPWENSSVPTSIVEVIERGLAADPEERWPSMESLLGALKPSRWRFILPVGVAAAVLGLGVATWGTGSEPPECEIGVTELEEQWGPASRESVQKAFAATNRGYADAVAATVSARLDGYVEVWTLETKDACSVHDAARGTEHAVTSERLACLDHAHTQFVAALDVLERADETIVQHSLDLVDALPVPSRCRGPRGSSAAFVLIEDPELAEAVTAGRAVLVSVSALHHAGKWAEALKTLDEAQLDEAGRHPPLAVELSKLRGMTLVALGRYPEAEAALQASFLRATRESLPFDACEVGASLAQLLAGPRSRPAEAQQVARVAVALGRSVDPGGPLEVQAHKAFANVLRHIGDPAAAEVEISLALGFVASGAVVHGERLADLHVTYGYVLEELGRLDGAEAQQRESLSIMLESSPHGHPNVGLARHNLAQALRRLDRLEDAESMERKAIGVLRAALGPSHPSTLTGLDNLGAILMAQGRMQEAQAQFEDALRGFEETLGAAHPQVAATASNLGEALVGLGEFAEAERQFRRAESLWRAAVGDDHPNLAVILGNLANVVGLQGRTAEAVELHAEALRLRESTLGREHPDVAMTLVRWSELLHRVGRNAEAQTKLARAWAIQSDADIGSVAKGETAFLLARVRWTLDAGDSGVESLLGRATVEFGTAAEAGQTRIAKLERWRDEHPVPRREEQR